MRELFIGNRRIADDEPPWVCAEIGHNHQGDLQKAKALIKAAAEAGCDAVKLQKRDNASLFTLDTYKAPYNSENAFGPTYGQHREALEFGESEYAELKQYAESLQLVFFATAFDVSSGDFLANLGVDCFKIASADLQNIPLLKHIASFGKPMIISTGGGTFADAQRAYNAVVGKAPVAFLQCTAAYPCIPAEMNLRVIQSFRVEFPSCVIGLSNHFDGIADALPAYMLGARIFEKHFTLSRAWKGTDHAWSLEPEGMRRYVRDLRIAEAMLGDGIKKPYPSEIPGLLKMGKSLVAARYLYADTVLDERDIAIKSPGGGLAPYELDQLIGKRLKVAMQADAPFSWHDVTDKPAEKVDFGLAG